MTLSRAWAFRITTALLVPAILLGVAEGALRIAGVGHPSSFTLRCDANGRPAWCDSPWFSRPFFPPGAFRLPPPFAIPAEKEPGTIRIFVVGESAAMGDPEPDYGLARTLDVMLAARYPDRRFEVFNTAVTAINSHVILPVVRDLATKEGDVFLVYMGNNEVVGHAGGNTVRTPRGSSLALIRAGLALQSTRLGQLAARVLHRRDDGSALGRHGMEMFLDRQVRADSPGLARVRAHFRENLRDILAAARGSGAQVLVSTVATNVADCAPFSSLHREGLGAERLAAFESEYRDGQAREAAGDWTGARARYESALAVDDQFADAHFRLARAQAALGNPAAARVGYARARDLDTLRFRADGALNAIIREEARRAGPGVTLVDAVGAFEAAAPRGLVGREFFLEHVHFTPEGTDLLARSFLARIDEVLPADARRNARALPTREEVQRRLALTTLDRRRLADDVLKRLGRPPFTNQLDHEAQLAAGRRDAAVPVPPLDATLAAYDEALALRPEDPVLLGRAGRLIAERDPARAAELFGRVSALLPSDPVAREGRANALVKLGRLDEAAAECGSLLAWMPFHPSAWLTLAYVRARQGKHDEAIAAYGEVARLAPDLAAAAQNEIGRIRLAQERFGDASDAFARASAAYGDLPEAADALFNRGHALRRAGRAQEAAAALDQAAARYRRELEGDAGSAALHYGLASTLAEQGDLAGAAAHFGRAADTDPGDAAAHSGLVRALELSGQTRQAAAAARRASVALAAAGRHDDAMLLARKAAALEREGAAP